MKINYGIAFSSNVAAGMPLVNTAVAEVTVHTETVKVWFLKTALAV